MKPVVLLATNDSEVEATVKAVAMSTDCSLKCAKTTQEAIGLLLGGSADHTAPQKLVVVDLDVRDGGRTLLRTAAGMLPVIAITAKVKPWLSSLEQHHRVGATLTKPLSPEKLRDALREIGHITSPTAQAERWPQWKETLNRFRSAFS